MLHFQMLKSPTFLLLLISGYLSLAATFVVFYYGALFGERKGLSPKMAMLLLSIIGISNTIGRAACGAVSRLTLCKNVAACEAVVFAADFVLAATGHEHRELGDHQLERTVHCPGGLRLLEGPVRDRLCFLRLQLG